MERLFSALPTPFFKSEIDWESLKKLIEMQINNGVEGLVLSGSTGEGHSLSKEEWMEIMKFGLKISNKRAKIVAGIGFNITSKAVEYVKIAEELGVDYILATTPYYNKPQQDGLYKHFENIANETKIPIILYNVPCRTMTDLQNETIVKLVKNFKNIVALKDATGQFDRIVDLKAKIDDVRKDFTMLSGNDDTQIGFNAMGGNGVISVVSNIAPQLCRNIQELTKDNNFKEALKFQNKLHQLSKAMFCETNPVPVKYALYKLGIFRSEECRLPLVNLTDKSKEFVDFVLDRCDIYSK